MDSSLQEHRKLIKSLLSSGTKVPEVERILVAQGIDQAAAAAMVDEVFQATLSRDAYLAPTPTRTFSLWRTAVGLLLAMGAGVAIYYILNSQHDGVPVAYSAITSPRPGQPAPGIWGLGATRLGLIGGCAGAAVAGLNIVRRNLMALWLSQ